MGSHGLITCVGMPSTKAMTCLHKLKPTCLQQAGRDHHGFYPEVVLGDTIYGSRDNRHYLKERGIRFAGKPLGRPKTVTEENQAELKRLAAKRRKEYVERIPIEEKFGQGKNG